MNPRRLTPSMSLLLAFEASARHLSFTRAADELALTQSAVSRQVQALEILLDVPLFRRDGRQITLTGAGAMYQKELDVALKRIRNASMQVIAYRAGGGFLHLAVLPTFATKWLMPRLKSFYGEHPEILIHVHSRIGQFDLELAGMDAAISVGDGIWPGLESYKLRDEHLVAIISPVLASQRPLGKSEDLAQYLLLQVAARPDAWQRWFSIQGIDPNIVRLGPQFELTSHLIQAVSSGIGIGLVPSFLVEDELKSGALELASDIPLVTGQSYYLFLPPQRRLLPPLATFKEWLLSTNDEEKTSN